MDGCLARTITKIEANPLLVRGKSDFRIMRVAAYCRVSTDDEDQLNSYQAQIAYYTDAIAKRPNPFLPCVKKKSTRLGAFLVFLPRFANIYPLGIDGILFKL